MSEQIDYSHPRKQEIIAQIEGIPREQFRKNEKEKWLVFKQVMSKLFNKGGELGTEYAESHVRIQQSEVLKNLQEAAKIAAEKGNIDAEIRVKNQKEVKKFNQNIDDIFANDGLPASAKMLKLAKLLENNPGIENQIEKVKNMIEQLSQAKGFKIELLDALESGNETNFEI